jgi:peptide/nickel transport system substrate-binding protein
MVIDRDRIGHLFDAPGWSPATGIVAPGTPEIPQPAAPNWATLTQQDRLQLAGRTVEHWIAGNGVPGPLRVALPEGPGARRLFASVARDWRMIGIDAVAVEADAPADLRLVDEVAPADIASFYLRSFACDREVPCTDVSDRVLVAAREAPSLEERAVLLIQADALINETQPFIAFGSPIRWSLVSSELDLYRDSPRGIHPLNELRSPLKR